MQTRLLQLLDLLLDEQLKRDFGHEEHRFRPSGVADGGKVEGDAGIGMQTLDQCLQNLVNKGVVSREAAREKAKIPENF